MSVIISSTIAFIMGYFLFGFIGERPIQGMEGLGISDMIPPILMFSCYGIVAGLIGILRNKRHFVEVDLHQVFPYLSSAIGYLIAHVIKNGFAKTLRCWYGWRVSYIYLVSCRVYKKFDFICSQ